MSEGHGDPAELVRENEALQRQVAALQVEAERFKTMLAEAQRAAQLGNWEWDAVRDEITGSEEFYRLFDVAPAELTRFELFVGRLHPDDRERVQQHVADALKRDRPYDTDYRVSLSDGRWRDILARGRVFTSSDGKPERMVGTCLDITERKRVDAAARAAQQALEQSERQYRTLAESLPHLVWTCRADGPCDYLSPRWVEYTGIPEAQQLGYRWLEQLHPDDRDRVIAEWSEVAPRGGAFDIEFRIRRADGVHRWFKTRAIPFVDDDGHVVKWFGSNTDIDDHKRAHEALRESEERNRATLYSIGDAVIATDAESRITRMNPMAERLTGWSEAEAQSRLLEQVFRIVNEETRAAVESPVTRVLREGKVVGLANHTLLIAKDGRERPIADSGAPIRDGKGATTGVVLVFRDQAEERAAQQALEASERRFRDTVTHLDQGYYSVSTDGLIIDHNLAFNRILGLDDGADLRGEPSPNFWQDPEDRSTYLSLLMTKGAVTGYRADAKTVRGEAIVVLLHAHLVRDEQGQVVRIEGTVTDDTERSRIEAALGESEEKYRSLFDNAQVGIYRSRLDGSGFLALNQRLADMFGFTKEEMLRNPATMRWADPQARQEMVELLRAHGELRNHELDIVTQGGGIRTVLASIKLYPGAGHLEGTAIDITERKQAEAALRSSNAMLQGIIEGTSNLVCVKDQAGKIVLTNSAMGRFLGKTQAEVEGKSDLELVADAEQAAMIADNDRRIMATGCSETVEEAGDGPSGRWNYLFTKSPYRDAEGQVVGVVGIGVDIAERKRMEERISHLNLALAAIRNVNQLIVREKDAETLIRRSCEVLTETRGYFSAWIALFDASGGYLSAASAGLGQTFEPLRCRIRNGGLGVCGEALHERGVQVVSDPATLCPNCPVAALYGRHSAVAVRLQHEGRVYGLLVMSMAPRLVELVEERNLIEEVADDIAYALHGLEVEKRRSAAEEDLRRHGDELELHVRDRTARLEESNKELEAFSYSVSHDLRAPLRAIDGFTRILTDDYAAQLDAEGKRICSVVRDNTSKMSRLIDDLLAFSRLGRAEMSLSRIDMGTMASSVFHELTTPESRARIDFQVGTLPSALADPTLMRQVWANLLSNAIKFSSKRERSVIKVNALPGDGGSVYAVQDNGAGFEMQYVGKLFGVFQRLHSSREFEGTGVGLALVQRVIRRHGGRVWGEGERDNGATFYFALQAEEE